MELLKQPLNSPMPVEEQVVSIYCGTKGVLDDLPVEQVQGVRGRAARHVPDPSRRPHGPRSATPGALPDDAVLRQAVDDFKARFVARTASAAADAAAAADVTDTDAEALGEADSAKTLDTE